MAETPSVDISEAAVEKMARCTVFITPEAGAAETAATLRALRSALTAAEKQRDKYRELLSLAREPVKLIADGGSRRRADLESAEYLHGRLEEIFKSDPHTNAVTLTPQAVVDYDRDNGGFE